MYSVWNPRVVILYIEDVDLNTTKSAKLTENSVILYIEDVDLNVLLCILQQNHICHPLH